MNLEEETKTELLSQISTFIDSDGQVEWECLIGRSNGYFGPINRGNFQDLIRRLKSVPGLEEVKQDEMLDISISAKRAADIIPIRATLTGRDNIVLFCKEDRRVLDSLSYLYKSPMINQTKIAPVDIPSFGIRSNLKAEIDIDLSTVNKDASAEEARRKYVDLLEKHDFYSLPKTFRYKNRISYNTPEGFRIDLTVIKSSKQEYLVTRSDNIIPISLSAKNIQGADLLNQPETYEVEIECDYAKIADYINRLELTERGAESGAESGEESEEGVYLDDLYNTRENQLHMLDLMIKNLGILLQVQQNWIRLTSLNEASKVIRNYNELVNRVVNDNLLKEINVDEHDSKTTTNYINLYKLLAKNIEQNKILKSPQINLTDSYQDIDKIMEVVGKTDVTFELASRALKSTQFKVDDAIELLQDSEKKQSLIRRITNKPRFIGPKPVSLSLINVQDSPNTKTININNYYTVTDKADGDGNLLYLDGTGKGYLIDTNLRVRYSGIHCPEEANTIINGEFISKDNQGNIKYCFYSYDIYIRKGQSVYELPLCYPVEWERSKKTKISHRLKEMRESIAEINRHPTGSIGTILETHVKQFYYQGSFENPTETSIYQLSKCCWDKFKKGDAPYKYDGLIYTPMYLPAGYDIKTENFIILPGITWNANFKWKPPNENSIDFLVETEQTTVFQKGSITIKKDLIKNKSLVNKDGDVEVIKYKLLNLYVGGYINNSVLACQTQGNVLNINPSTNQATTYGKKLFNPSLAALENAYLAPVALTNGQLLSEDDGNIIEDGTIVEFNYNMDATNEFIWTAKRTRYDKTFEYLTNKKSQERLYVYLKHLFNHRVEGKFTKNSQFVTKSYEWKLVKMSKNPYLGFDFKKGYLKGQKFVDVAAFLKLVSIYHYNKNRDKNSLFDYLQRNFKAVIPNQSTIPIQLKYGQNEDVANNIWLTIHQPVTELMITGQESIPPVNDDEIYYENCSQENRHKSDTIHLQKYHNFVKRCILLRPAKNSVEGEEMTLLDLGCGKGGDLSKWKDVGADIVVGVDVAKDNLDNRNDGACTRYSELVKLAESRNESYPTCFFFHANSKHDIANEIKSRNNEEAKIFRHIWYDSEPLDVDVDSNTAKKPVTIYPRFSYNGFNCVSIQFALHYFMENITSLTGLLDNVNTNLKKGGLFIGCCLDGEQLFKSLSGVKDIQGSHNGNIVWKIEKGYQAEEYLPTNNSLGMAVDVYMSSINRVHREYLVNFEYLRLQLEKAPYNMVPLTAKMATKYGFPNSYDPNTALMKFSELRQHIINENEDLNILATPKELSYLKPQLEKMTEAEREISDYNVAFAFYKKA